uniref:Peroxiredoxin n=1 Tax=Meloidogyne hapla TaxID=6305 RepID=A0A1I8C3G4_MELHA
MLLLGNQFPDFSADTSVGKIESFHQWIGENTTELARAAQLAPEFASRNTKLIALSCNSVQSHLSWLDDIVEYNNKYYGKIGQKQHSTDTESNLNVSNFPFPIIADENRHLATKLGMLDPLNLDISGIPLTVRAVFFIDPQKRLRLSILYPASTGRNFDELIRVLDSMLLSDEYMLATPEGWNNGSPCMIEPKVGSEEANKLYSSINTLQLPSGKGYMRVVDQPLNKNKLEEK